jgi:hypothetical protein
VSGERGPRKGIYITHEGEKDSGGIRAGCVYFVMWGKAKAGLARLPAWLKEVGEDRRGTHWVFYEKTKNGERLFLSFFSLMKRSKNHTRSVFYERTVHNLLKNIILRLKSFNSSSALKDFHALIIYFLNANSVMSGRERLSGLRGKVTPPS